MVTKLNIKEGDRVEKGALLAKLEDVDYRAEYDHAVANAEAAKRRCDELWKYRDMEIQQAKADLADSKAQLHPTQDRLQAHGRIEELQCRRRQGI